MSDYENKATISASADDVVKLMTTTEYVEAESIVDGALSVKARIEKSDGKSVTIVVERSDPGREPGAKSSKPEKSVVTLDWDIQARRNRWSTKVIGREKLVKITGATWVEPAGDARCNLCEKGSITINLPLIGKLIANGLASDLKKSLPQKARLVEKKLKEKQ